MSILSAGASTAKWRRRRLETGQSEPMCQRTERSWAQFDYLLAVERRRDGPHGRRIIADRSVSRPAIRQGDGAGIRDVASSTLSSESEKTTVFETPVAGHLFRRQPAWVGPTFVSNRNSLTCGSTRPTAFCHQSNPRRWHRPPATRILRFTQR